MMNRFLANAVGFINALIAIVLILVGTVIGSNQGGGGMVLGFIGGLLLAIFVCGLLALAIEIRNELVQIRKALTHTNLSRAA
jgi:hypothetical protein